MDWLVNISSELKIIAQKTQIVTGIRHETI